MQLQENTTSQDEQNTETGQSSEMNTIDSSLPDNVSTVIDMTAEALQVLLDSEGVPASMRGDVIDGLASGIINIITVDGRQRLGVTQRFRDQRGFTHRNREITEDDTDDSYEDHKISKEEEAKARRSNFKIPVYGKSFAKMISQFNRMNKVFSLLAHQRNDKDFTGEVNYVKICSDGTIGYLPVDKFNQVKEKIVNREISSFAEGIGRIKCKPGKFINKFIDKETLSKNEITQRDIEEFSLIVKSGDEFYYGDCEIRIVSGEDIKKYYLEENYHESMAHCGSLWGSV